jgi:uroporphyrinogen decarboxylase
MTWPAREDFLKTVRHEPSSGVPVAVYNAAPFTTAFTGTEINAYYRDPALKMAAQLKLLELLPGVATFPPLWADFGPVLECSAFGSEILWLDRDPPFAKPAIRSYADIDRVKPANPDRDGLMPVALEHYRYMWDHLDRKYLDKWGFLEGTAVTVGPVETAGLLIDYQNFFLGFYEDPGRIKRLLEVVTESILRWIGAQEKVNGRLKQLILIDHMPAQVSAEQFEEFCFPYLERVFHEYAHAVRLYHNEGNVRHVLTRIADMGTDIFHFGIDAGVAKKAIGHRVILMGNIHPVNVLLSRGPAEVREMSRNCLEAAAPGGNFILSSAGGLAPGTPQENIEAMAQAARSWPAHMPPANGANIFP